MTQHDEDLATAVEMQDFALKAFARFAHQADYRAQQWGRTAKEGRDEATERALDACIAFFLATARIEELTGQQPGHVAAPAPFPASK